MLFSFRFQAEILCLLACLSIPTQSNLDQFIKTKHPWWFGKTRCGNFGKGDSNVWKDTFRYPDQDIPNEFDARKKWPECKSIQQVPRESFRCENSWAIIVATMLTDRLCIESKGKNESEFSINHLLTCCTECLPSPGFCLPYFTGPRRAVEYWAENGTVSGASFSDTLGCKPFDDSIISGPGLIEKCEENCSNANYNISFNDDKMFGKGIGCMFEPWTIEQVQIEIMTNGPVVTTVSLTTEFSRYYNGGIYNGTEYQQSDGRTVVKIIGWGVEKELPYWLGLSAWGKYWGEEGFFKILRGKNVRDVEHEAWAGYFHEVTLDSASAPTILNSSKFTFFIIFLFGCVINYIQRI